MTETFYDLGLHPELLQAVDELGYKTPSPIQEQAIPLLLEGADVLGQAQTGTGKTAAFSLPMLQNMDMDARGIQALVMTPTRELAGQVCTSIYEYGKHLNIRALPIYGGTSYDRQLRRLEKGVQIVVGTPGRLLDLIKKRALDLSTVQYVVLDEADEMLKMGFIEDVEAILSAVPRQRQTALFSATFSGEVRRLADQYMNDPISVTVARKQVTVPQIEQRHYLVNQASKVVALSRLLETENLSSILIFTRTRAGSSELAEQLLERGFIADALHGELNQSAREAILRRFRSGSLPILVATDVVARGVDINDVSHVINYDMPYDPEDYVHRIGRTGRAGRDGIAITLVTPRETRRLKDVERYTRKSVPRMEIPKLETVREHRDRRFFEGIGDALTNADLQDELNIVLAMREEGFDPEHIAAAAIRMARADELNRPVEHLKPVKERKGRSSNGRRGSDRGDRRGAPRRRRSNEREKGMVRLKINVGNKHGIRPRDIVGGIAGETGIPGKAIGAIDIQDNFTYFDVKDSHVDNVLDKMKHRNLRGKNVDLQRA